MDIFFSHNIYYKRFIQARMVNFVILLFIQVVLQNICTLFLISIKLEKEPNVMKVKKKQNTVDTQKQLQSAAQRDKKRELNNHYIRMNLQSGETQSYISYQKEVKYWFNKAFR